MLIFNEDYKLNTFFSGKDVYFNFDKWKSGEINKALVLGLSGSGKSTLADKLAEMYNCDVVHLDMFRGNVHFSDEQFKAENPLLYKYFTEIWTHGDRRSVKTMPKEIRDKERNKCIYWLLELPQRIVIEGMLEQVLEENEQVRQFPIIFKGTSTLKSMSRMLSREINRENETRGPIEKICWLLKHCSKYKRYSDIQSSVRDKVYKTNGDNYEELDEGFLPDLTFYHGSDRKFNKLEPNCFDAGNRLKSSPRWGAYMFKDKKLAFLWAIVRVVSNCCEKAMMDRAFVRSSTDNETLYAYPYATDIFGINVNFRLIVKNKVYDEIRDICDGEKFYVYTLSVPLDTRLSLGTTNTLPEYTVDYSPEIIKVEEYILTKELFEEYFERVTDKEFADIKRLKPHKNNVRGLLGYFLYDIERRQRMRKLVAQKIDAGELEIGGNLGFLGESVFNNTNNIPTFTHAELMSAYNKDPVLETHLLKAPYKSGNITQYIPGAYFNEEVGVWMRKPNREELAKLNHSTLSENFKINMEFLNNEYD